MLQHYDKNTKPDWTALQKELNKADKTNGTLNYCSSHYSYYGGHCPYCNPRPVCPGCGRPKPYWEWTYHYDTPYYWNNHTQVLC